MEFKDIENTTLSPRQKTVLILYYGFGPEGKLSRKEIATLLGVSYTRISQLYHQGHNRIICQKKRNARRIVIANMLKKASC